MTDNEIIKAYGCCNLSHDECGGCDNCPCKIEGECIVPSGLELEREVFNLLHRQKAEIERLNTEITEKTRALFQAVVSKFMSIKDLYVIVDGEYLPWEPSEEVEHLFGMSISGDNDEIDKETDRVIKEWAGDKE